MSLKDSLIVIFGALVLIALVFGGFVFFLLYGDQFFHGDPNSPNVTCSEESVGGLCGIRHFLERNRSAEGTIDL